MNRTLRTLFLLASLLALSSAAATRPVMASPDGPPILPFGGTFVSNGDPISVAGFVHLEVLAPSPPPISPQAPQPPPIRIYANLLDTSAIDLSTGQTYAGTGSWLFQGFGPLPNAYAFTAFYRLTPDPPPISLSPTPPPILPLSFVVGVNGDGSVSDASVFVGGGG